MMEMHNDFGPPQDLYGGQMQEIHQVQHDSLPNEMGETQQMVPPQINVEFAPTSRVNSFDPPKPSFDQDTLSPPDRGTSNRRIYRTEF
jgi:hypothetical protein